MDSAFGEAVGPNTSPTFQGPGPQGLQFSSYESKLNFKAMEDKTKRLSTSTFLDDNFSN